MAYCRPYLLMARVRWIEAVLVAARPQAVGALLRYFRDLDTAEEAFQEACLRALKAWPQNGPPRDPAAWLILVGRNAAMDQLRRQARQTKLPDEAWKAYAGVLGHYHVQTNKVDPGPAFQWERVIGEARKLLK